VLFANDKVPAKTVTELVTYIKANPGKVNFNSAGNSSPVCGSR
jgi:tripartite-type tricarboxylate transporter receptor subunit TctC